MRFAILLALLPFAALANVVPGSHLTIKDEHGQPVKSAQVKQPDGRVVRVYVSESDCKLKMARAWFYLDGKRTEVVSADFEATFVAVCKGK